MALHFFSQRHLTQDFFDGTFFNWSRVNEAKAERGERSPDDCGSVDRDGLGVDAILEKQAIVETLEEGDFALDFTSREREIDKDGITVIMVRLGETICE